MRFGTIPLGGAKGLILAHAVSLPDGRIAKVISLDRTKLDRLARSGVATVVGAAGCARHLEENGFVRLSNSLPRDIEVLPKDTRRPGLGGSPSEIPNRPQPRQPSDRR